MASARAVVHASPIVHPSLYEIEHVHEVYDSIALHFSSTRYKPWPLVENFLASIPVGWVGLDSGTGNGKYLPLPIEKPRKCWSIGLDHSRHLLEIAKHAGGFVQEVVQGDVLQTCWRRSAFDYAISIATIHHLSTAERRKQAMKALISCLSPSHGRALVYVWATQQDPLSKRYIPPNSSTGSLEMGQDVFVPWVSNQQANPAAFTNGITPGDPLKEMVFNRYYHMFEEGELKTLVLQAATEMNLHFGALLATCSCDEACCRGVEVVQDGWERSNFYVELRLWQK